MIEDDAGPDSGSWGDAPGSGEQPSLRAEQLDWSERCLQNLWLHMNRLTILCDLYQQRQRSGKAAPGDKGGSSAEDLTALEECLATTESELSAESKSLDLPSNRIRQRFGLRESAWLFLIAAAAPALDYVLSRRLAALHGRGQPDVGFLIDVLARDGREAQALLAELRSGAPLLKWGLLRLGEAKGWQPETPLLHRPVVVRQRVVEWLHGLWQPELELMEGAGRYHTASEVAVLPSAQHLVQARLETFRTHDPFPLLVLGSQQVGKTAAVVAAAAALGRGTLAVDLALLAGVAQPLDELRTAALDATFLDAVLLFKHADALGDKRPELRAELLRQIADLRVPVVLTAQLEEPIKALRLPRLSQVELESPSLEEQDGVWSRALATHGLALPRGSSLQEVGRYRLPPGDIHEACRQLVRQKVGSSPSREDLLRAVRGRLKHRLGDTAELVTTGQAWSDVVLSDDLRSRLFELLSAVEHERKVMGDWGFAGKVKVGRAVAALFFGAPGTGKTMVAGLLAKSLGMDLYRVDLSRIMSKWVGETERNLAALFAEAKRASAALLFDEGDALFAKRTDVKSANDRYANLEVNYLLQRLETHEGVVMITTNKLANIDEAFMRRFRFRIEFPAPDEHERLQLWKAMLPASVPHDQTVNLEELATRFEMSGGYIKNAVLRAAYFAAAQGEKLSQDLLLIAAELEWQEMGRLV